VVFERRGAAWRARSELRRSDPVRRARAAEILGTLGRKDAVPDLCELLRDGDTEVRVVAARALGRIGAAAAARPLLEAVGSRRRGVPAHFAAHALSMLGTAAQPTLTAALGSPYETVRATAAEVLGLVGAVGATGRVEEALRGDRSIEVRVRAARTLGRLGTRTALPPLLEAVKPGQPTALRVEAARSLGELGTVAAAEALTEVLADREHEVAHHAARALLKLGNRGRIALTAAGSAHAREALAIAAIEEQRRLVH